MEARDYPAIAEGYARDVGRGRIPAGKSIRLQCARYLAELKVARRREFPFRFDPDRASRVCRFIERLPHSKGKWARSKETIRLEPWQIWILCASFGWVEKATGNRRYRLLFVVVPRKNGKSALSAGVGLYMLCADGEFGAEVYSGATNERQAWEVFKPAQLMAQRTPALVKRFGLSVNAKNIVSVGDNSKFETIIGSPGDGQSPSCSIHDEYHEHADDDQVETMRTGMGAREQAMQVLITTAGVNLAGPCFARLQEDRKRLAGIGVSGEAAERLAAFGLPPGPDLEDRTFLVEYTIDEGDDWRAEASLRKANPNYGVSVNEDFLRSELRDAISRPRRAGVFKTKHLNLWVSTKAAFFDIEAWRRCHDVDLPERAEKALDLERLAGRRCIAGLDLASKIDIAALELLFPPIGPKATRDDPYIRLGWSFLPADTVEAVPHYSAWHAADLLDVTDGNVTDYDAIIEALRLIRSRCQLETVAYDPHQATYLVTTLQKEGFPVLEYRPLTMTLSEPMKELDALTRSGRIAHGGDAVMEWQMSNVVAQPDAKDNVYPRKPDGQLHLKIDNPVALMSALGVAMRGEENEQMFSPWDDPTFSLATAA